MSDSDTERSESPDGARMILEPKTLHEGTDEPSVDCPQCGATVSLQQIIEEGHCTGYLDSDDSEVEEDGEQLQQGGCTAELALELVWEA